jgi:hypothetical protein
MVYEGDIFSLKMTFPQINHMDCFLFRKKEYNEAYDPSPLSTMLKVPIVPSYPYKNEICSTDRYNFTDYSSCKVPVIQSDECSFNMPLILELFIEKSDENHVEQIVQFQGHHKLVDLYNHSEMIRMHLHNHWILHKPSVKVILPCDLFPTPAHVFVFCGTMHPLAICPLGNRNLLDLCKFLEAAFFLMITDTWLEFLLSKIALTGHRENYTFIKALYILLNSPLNLPHTLYWFSTKIPYYDTHEIMSCVIGNTYRQFRTHLRNFVRSTERQVSFDHYTGPLSLLRHCTDIECISCEQKGLVLRAQEINIFNVQHVYEPSHIVDEIFLSTFLTPLTHECTPICVGTEVIYSPKAYRYSNINSIVHQEVRNYAYYQTLDVHGRLAYRTAHVHHNYLYPLAVDNILRHLGGLFSKDTIIDAVIPTLSYTKIRMIAAGIYPIIDRDPFYYILQSFNSKLSHFFPAPKAADCALYPNELRTIPRSFTDKNDLTICYDTP